MDASEDRRDAFSFLEDTELAAVTFIWNYYQLLFGTETVSIYSDPIVVDKGTRRSKQDAGYRDALCGCIGKKVIGVRSDSELLEIHLAEDITLKISLKPQDRVAAELQESLVVNNPEGNVLVVGDSEASE